MPAFVVHLARVSILNAYFVIQSGEDRPRLCSVFSHFAFSKTSSSGGATHVWSSAVICTLLWNSVPSVRTQLDACHSLRRSVFWPRLEARPFLTLFLLSFAFRTNCPLSKQLSFLCSLLPVGRLQNNLSFVVTTFLHSLLRDNLSFVVATFLHPLLRVIPCSGQFIHYFRSICPLSRRFFPSFH